jgi:hypothetical protein
MIIKVELINLSLDVEDAISFAQNKKEYCLIYANKQLKGKCIENGWVHSVLEVSNISDIYINLFNKKINNITYNALVEIDYVNEGSIILATVESIDSKFINLVNDRASITVPVTYTQDGLTTEIDMNIFKINQILPIAIKDRTAPYKKTKVKCDGQLYIPLPSSIRFILKGEVNYSEFVPYIKIAENLQEKIKGIKNDFIEKILYPYNKDKTGDLDQMSMVSIINIANGSEDYKKCKYIKDARINWGVTPYLMKETLGTDSHPPSLISTKTVPAQQFIKVLLTNYIYNAELFIDMHFTYKDDVIKQNENLWKLLNAVKK